VTNNFKKYFQTHLEQNN